jgi:large-conductance mechanosensitive channel MscL
MIPRRHRGSLWTRGEFLGQRFIMPPIGLLHGKSDFSCQFLNLSRKSVRDVGGAKAAGAATINHGIFLNAVFDFLIVTLTVFMLIRRPQTGSIVFAGPAEEHPVGAIPGGSSATLTLPGLWKDCLASRPFFVPNLTREIA